MSMTWFFLLCLLAVGGCQGCPTHFMSINGGCYRFVRQGKHFWPAQADCRRHNSGLMVVDSKEEEVSVQKYIYQNFGENSWRIGLYQDNAQPKCRPGVNKDCIWTWVYQPGNPSHLLKESDYSGNNKSIHATTATFHKDCYNCPWRWSGAWYGTGVPYICEIYSAPKETVGAPVNSEDNIKTTKATNTVEQVYEIATEKEESEDMSDTKPLTVETAKPPVKSSHGGPHQPAKPSNCHTYKPQPPVSGNAEADDHFLIHDDLLAIGVQRPTSPLPTTTKPTTKIPTTTKPTTTVPTTTKPTTTIPTTTRPKTTIPTTTKPTTTKPTTTIPTTTKQTTTIQTTFEPDYTKCYPRGKAYLYRGSLGKSKTGKTCQDWNSQWPKPHIYGRLPGHFNEGKVPWAVCRDLMTHGKGDHPWCYVITEWYQAFPRWEYCDVPVC